jgi:Protein of unknown function (DUF664)
MRRSTVALRGPSRSLASDGLDGIYHTAGGSAHTLRRPLVDMIEEYAGHTSRADLLREAIDGRVGEDPPGRPYSYGQEH